VLFYSSVLLVVINPYILKYFWRKGRRAMAQSDENGILFIGRVPFVYSKRNIERQQKIETWLTLYKLKEDLKVVKKELAPQAATPSYIC
jgi:hypothetical protein